MLGGVRLLPSDSEIWPPLRRPEHLRVNCSAPTVDHPHLPSPTSSGDIRPCREEPPRLEPASSLGDPFRRRRRTPRASCAPYESIPAHSTAPHGPGKPHHTQSSVRGHERGTQMQRAEARDSQYWAWAGLALSSAIDTGSSSCASILQAVLAASLQLWRGRSKQATSTPPSLTRNLHRLPDELCRSYDVHAHR